MMRSTQPDYKEYYWESYGMTHDPFSEFSHRYFYPLPEWDEQAQLLEQSTLYNNLLVVVQGPRGSGKTTFMEQLQQRIASDVSCFQIDGDSELSPDEVLKILGHAYSLPELPFGRMPRPDLFKIQITNIVRSGRHCVLMIDDAHLLPPETLNALMLCIKEQSQSQAYFHLVLFAEPTISHWKATLTQQDRDQLLQELEMPRLDAEMAEAYLEHRLHAAGLREKLPIASDDVATITEEADGLIGEINHLAKNHLRSQGAGKRGRSSGVASRSAMAFGVGLLVAVFVGYFVWQSMIPNEETVMAEALPQPTALKQELLAQAVASESQQTEKTLESYVSPVVEAELALKVLPSQLASIHSSDLVLKAQSKTVAMAKKIARPVFRQPAKAKTPALQQSRYVIQVFATHDKASADKFIREQHLAGKAQLRVSKFKGQRGFLVLVGPYPNESSARSAVLKLSSTVKQLHPWVREVSSIG